LARNFRSLPPRLTVNAFLVRSAAGLVLVDTGTSDKMGPDLGHLVGRLQALGVDPAEIGTVLITHAHIDHVCGLLTPDGALQFPNASVVLSEMERDFWLNESHVHPDGLAQSVATARAALGPYGERVVGIADGAEPVPGIRAMALPGHTPGHTGWMLSSGDAGLLIWGDVVHLPGLQFSRPDAGMVFDVDVALAQASRRRAFDMAATDRVMVAGMHLDFPTFGHVEMRVEGYGFVPVVWEP
jgi:glyoxylase-like metal-dependent hydrolase (beta-lactamase superfamily II)